MSARKKDKEPAGCLGAIASCFRAMVTWYITIIALALCYRFAGGEDQVPAGTVIAVVLIATIVAMYTLVPKKEKGKRKSTSDVATYATRIKHHRIPAGMDAKDYARSLLRVLRQCSDEINHTSEVSTFSLSYAKLSAYINELIWVNEKKKVPMFPTPRTDWREIQNNLGTTINCFIERATSTLPTYGEARADALEVLLEEIEGDATLSSILRQDNKIRIEQLRNEAAKIREHLAREEEQQQRADRMSSLGTKSNIDASDLDPFAVADKLEQQLKTLYQFCLVRGLSPSETLKAYSRFKENCKSSKLPLASEIRLEDLLEIYEPKFAINNPIHAIDSMDGESFELWCASLLRKLDFVNVQVTKASGDDGVDILAEKEGIRYAVQCKCYSSNLGKGPIQEVNAGKTMPKYHCQIGAVMTNQYFTKGAKELAEANGVLLWDRDWIVKAVEATQ